MDLNNYQIEAQKTDRVPERDKKQTSTERIVPLLGLAGEVGELLSEYKKELRDGTSHTLHNERICEELGDLLWYIANLASKYGLTLEKIAEKNLEKIQDRWGDKDTSSLCFDTGYPDNERFPRSFQIELREVNVDGKTMIRATKDGEQIGDELTDNADDPDGYRFHDVFHLSYAAVLGWSPVIRKLLNLKRRSAPKIDEVQDGGRARVIDEGVSALVFEYARQHNWLEGIQDIDYQLLRTIKGFTSLLEVKHRTMQDWQKAILLGFDVWRQVKDNKGGIILVDLDRKTLEYQP